MRFCRARRVSISPGPQSFPPPSRHGSSNRETLRIAFQTRPRWRVRCSHRVLIGVLMPVRSRSRGVGGSRETLPVRGRMLMPVRRRGVECCGYVGTNVEMVGHPGTVEIVPQLVSWCDQAHGRAQPPYRRALSSLGISGLLDSGNPESPQATAAPYQRQSPSECPYGRGCDSRTRICRDRAAGL